MRKVEFRTDDGFLEKLMDAADVALRSYRYREGKVKESRAEDYLTLRYYFLFLTRRALDDEELARELDPILVELSQESWLDGEFYVTLSQILAVRHELDGEGNSDLSEEFLEERFEDLMKRVDLKEAGRAKETMMEHDRRRKEKKGESGEKGKNPMWG